MSVLSDIGCRLPSPMVAGVPKWQNTAIAHRHTKNFPQPPYYFRNFLWSLIKVAERRSATNTRQRPKSGDPESKKHRPSEEGGPPRRHPMSAIPTAFRERSYNFPVQWGYPSWPLIVHCHYAEQLSTKSPCVRARSRVISFDQLTCEDTLGVSKFRNVMDPAR